MSHAYDYCFQALRKEITTLKSIQAITGGTVESPPAIATPPVDNTALAQQLFSYQTFMEEYMVNAQNQKLQAVREAELKAEKKFQERLEKLLAASNAALKESSVDATVLSTEPTLFEKRNARIVAAAKAGVSRWGKLEVDKAANEQTKTAPVAESTPASFGSTAEPTLFDQRNAMIIAAANAGKSRWGAMEIKRAQSSGVSLSAVASSPISSESSLFDQRNAKVIASAAAGKSRWGSMEVDRAQGTATNGNVVPISASVSLEDRVNLGAQLLGTSKSAASSVVQSTSLYDQRNAMVIAAASAGKSRWGRKEVERVTA